MYEGAMTLLLLKYWREGVIGLVSLLLTWALFYIYYEYNQIKSLKQDHLIYVQQQEQLQLKAQVDADQKMITAERNYNEKIKQINADANHAQSVANSLSKQLSSAKERLSQAPKQTIIEYTNTNSDVLNECITEYREVAQKADGHATDAKRLSDAWHD